MPATQITALREAASDGPVDCDGLRVEHTADGYVFETTEHRYEDLDEEAFADVAAEHPQLVSNWQFWARDRPDADRAFLRWVEGADERNVHERYDALGDGLSRSWGEVLVTAELGNGGERRYHLRHEDDADTDLAALETYDDPHDARSLVTYDDDGRYRPLKTAPSLPHGWAFTDLDGRGCTRTVDLIYPATVANWYREREGTLDVDHYRETAERQTGIYDIVDELPREAVEWLAEACCVDSQCLRRRMWDEDEETPLDVPRGDGEFPCREPCSLVIAAARTWTKLEQEESRTYEFELTPSEKEQLEELVDAVADGRVDEVREADVSEGANRYRARYLRAKLIDDDGNLGGVPTDD